MRKIENLGVVKTKHHSGIVETDKGAKYPNFKCEIGDIMLDVDLKRIIVSPEVYESDYKADAVKYEKQKKAALKKQEEAKAKKQEELSAAEKKKALADAKKNAQLEAAQAEIAQLKADKEKEEAAAAASLLEEMEKESKDA